MPETSVPLLQKAGMSYLQSAQILGHHLGYVLNGAALQRADRGS